VLQVASREDYLHRIVPLGFCSASTLALGNMAYMYLDVGLLQMLKSCCPVFVMLVAIAFRLERFSWPLVASIGFIAAGTATTAASGAPPRVRRVATLGHLSKLFTCWQGGDKASQLCKGLQLKFDQLRFW
jgi:drug/metabolite transporter (DMT)-like permease